MNGLRRLIARQMGREGGLQRAAKRTKAELSEIGRKGARARWAKAAMNSLTLACRKGK